MISRAIIVQIDLSSKKKTYSGFFDLGVSKSCFLLYLYPNLLTLQILPLNHPQERNRLADVFDAANYKFAKRVST
jgi:hypothetical protein